MTYYDSIVVIALLAIITLIVIVYENARLTRNQKTVLFQTYLIIALAIVIEWAGVALNNAPSWTIPLHRVVKALDYIISPIVIVFLSRVISSDKISQKIQIVLLSLNGLLQIISIFTGWTFYVDSSNVYEHGPLYIVYMVIYSLAIVYGLYMFLIYGKRFKRRNITSLILIVILLVAGISFQEIFSGELRTICITLVLMSILLFIHMNEHDQFKRDEDIEYQQRMLTTDVMTGLYNRYAYTRDIEILSKEGVLPENTVVVSMDVNALKLTNDTIGHNAGDELIIGVAECMNNVLSKYGKVYRTGGDEFVAILQLPQIMIPVKLCELRKILNEKRGVLVKNFSISIGYAASDDNPNLNIEKLAVVADQFMYEEKREYHKKMGITDR